MTLALAPSRLLIAEGDARGTIAILRPRCSHARSRRSHRLAIAAGVPLARALAACGDLRAAQRMLMECLQMGELGRLVRGFVDEGPEPLSLIVELCCGDEAQGRAIGDRSIMVCVSRAQSR